MGDEKSSAATILNNNKSSVKLFDSLKKQTHFSRYFYSWLLWVETI